MRQIRTTIRINVPYRAHKEGELWVAYCPSLEIASQGRTKAESKKNLIEAISLFFVSCYERGTLNEALKELGFRPSVARKRVGEKRTGGLSFLEVQIPFEVNERMDYCAVQMQALKPLSWKKLACVFESLGFRFERQKGSHRSYVKPGVARPLVIPKESEVLVFIITGLMKTAGIDRATFFELLKEC